MGHSDGGVAKHGDKHKHTQVSGQKYIFSPPNVAYVTYKNMFISENGQKDIAVLKTDLLAFLKSNITILTVLNLIKLKFILPQ